MRLNLGHFQGIKNDAIEWKTVSFDRGQGPIELFVPQFTENQLLILCKQVKQASQTYLKNVPVSHVVDIIDTVTSSLLDRSNPYRQQAEYILPKITGYDPQMIRLGLTNYLKINDYQMA